MAFHKILALMFFVVTASAVTAQNLIPNQYALGGANVSSSHTTLTDSFGNYYLFIYVNNSNNSTNGNLGTFQYGESYFVVSKHAPNHELIWRNAYGGDSVDIITGAVKVSDGFIISCQSNSPVSGTKTIASNGFHHLWLQKIDFNGNVVWQKGFYTNDYLQVINMTTLNDGNLLISTVASPGVGGDKTVENIGLRDIWLLKVDLNGEKIWDITIGTEDDDFNGLHIGSFSNGDILIGSMSWAGISGDKSENSFGSSDLWLVRITSTDGTIIWDKTIGGSEGEEYFIGKIINDEVFIFINSNSDISGLRTVDKKGIQDVWYIRLDSVGEILHQSCFGGSDTERIGAIHEITENEIFMAIHSNSPVSLDKNEESRGSVDIWLVRADIEGNILHQKTIGGGGGDGAEQIVTLTNGNYLIVARSNSGISGEKTIPRIGPLSTDVWVLEIDAVTLDIVNQHQVINESTLYPIPATNQINIAFNEATQLIKAVLYDVSGKVVREQNYTHSFEQSFVFSTAGLASGVYTLRLEGNTFVKTQQVVVE